MMVKRQIVGHFQHFHRFLIRSTVNFRSATHSANLIAKNRTKREAPLWGDDEKRLLAMLVPYVVKNHVGYSWEAVTNEFFPRRTVRSVSIFWWRHYLSLYNSGQLSSPPLPTEIANRIDAVISRSSKSIAKKYWTKEEDDLVISLADTIAKKKGTWRGFEHQLPPNRSASACQARYIKLMAAQRNLSDNASQSSYLPSLRLFQPWSTNDDRSLIDVLVSITDRRKIPWEYIVPTFFPNRTLPSVQARYRELKKAGHLDFDRDKHIIQPKNKKKIATFLKQLKVKPPVKGFKWNTVEDEKLKKGVFEFGDDFIAIVNKYFTTTDENGHRKVSKTNKQCRHRWMRVLDPQLSRGSWSTAEIMKLQELIIAAYREIDPKLDINKIIRREACWPKDIRLPYASIARQLREYGYYRHADRCVLAWQSLADPSLIPPDTPWTDEEREKVRVIGKRGESMVEAWRQTHRSVSECRHQWRYVLRTDLKRGPLSIDEQSKLFIAFSQLGSRNYQQVKKDMFPQRTSTDLSTYWKSAQLRIQKIVFDNFDASITIRKQCTGYNNEHFLPYLQSLNLTEEQCRTIVEELEKLRSIAK